MVASSSESYLSKYVTSERLAELGRIISDANKLQAWAILVQGLALVAYYSLFYPDFSFWTLVPEERSLLRSRLARYCCPFQRIPRNTN